MHDAYEHDWERWVGSTVAPQRHLKARAKVTRRPDGRTWITYPDVIKKRAVIVEMPADALTASCDRDGHDRCPHRLGAPQEGGALLTLIRPTFLWRCGCPFDVLPGLKVRGFPLAAHAAVGVLPVSTPTAATGCGLTWAPQSFSLSARPAARMTLAAL